MSKVHSLSGPWMFAVVWFSLSETMLERTVIFPT